jgi:hypothetical protein
LKDQEVSGFAVLVVGVQELDRASARGLDSGSEQFPERSSAFAVLIPGQRETWYTNVIRGIRSLPWRKPDIAA